MMRLFFSGLPSTYTEPAWPLSKSDSPITSSMKHSQQTEKFDVKGFTDQIHTFNVNLLLK